MVEANADVHSWIRRHSTGADRYLFGVAGPPGSGKSTFADLLGDALGAPVVPMDGFHLPNEVLRDRGQFDVKGAPDTFAAADFVALVGDLRDASRAIGCPGFDRTIDEPVADQIQVVPDDVVVIVEGNYLLLDRPPWSSLPSMFHAIAYLDVPREVRFRRLVDRHVEFGRSRADAEAFVRRSDAPNAVLVEATRERADFVVPYESHG